MGEKKRLLSLSYGAKQLFTNRKKKKKKTQAKEAKSRLRITVEAEKIKFRNSWSAGSEHKQQTKRPPNNESVLPKGT